MLALCAVAGACATQPAGMQVRAELDPPQPAIAIADPPAPDDTVAEAADPAAPAGPTAPAAVAGPGRRRGAAATGTATRAVAAAAPALPAPAVPRSELFSTNVDGLWNDSWNWSDEDRDRQFRTMAASGLAAVRAGVVWQEVQGCKPGSWGCSGEFDWARHDEWIGALAKAGLRADLLLGWSATWASSFFGNQFAAPANIEDFTTYARAVVGRYGRNGAFWRSHPDLPYHPATTFEVWNEQNEAHWWRPRPDPGAYAGLYLATRDAVKQVDPAAAVIVGGLAAAVRSTSEEQADTEFLRQMFERRPDLAGRVDGVGTHPYSPSADGVIERIVALRATLRAVGEGDVPLYVTELGWATAGTKHAAPSEAARAAMLSDVLPRLAGSACGVARISVYTWVSPERDPHNDEDWMGVFNRDTTPKPSGRAFIDAVGAVDRGVNPAAAKAC